MKALVALTLLAASAAAWAGPVNINTASVEKLAVELKGSGPVKAAAIVKFRAEHGSFKTPEGLKRACCDATTHDSRPRFRCFPAILPLASREMFKRVLTPRRTSL